MEKAKEKSKGPKAINFIQRTNSIVINSEMELEEHRLRLSQDMALDKGKGKGLGQSKFKSKVFP